MRSLRLKTYFTQYWVIGTENREVLHLRPTISTGKIQFLQLAMINKRGFQTIGPYDYAKIEDDNRESLFLPKDTHKFPHHYAEEEENDVEPDIEQEHVPPTTIPIDQWNNIMATFNWTATTT
jgi:hypothetical protein